MFSVDNVHILYIYYFIFLVYYINMTLRNRYIINKLINRINSIYCRIRQQFSKELAYVLLDNMPAFIRNKIETSNHQIARNAVKLGAIQKVSELTAFLWYLDNKVLNVVVEIGTCKGWTLYALCKKATDDALIISIDLPWGQFWWWCTKEHVIRIETYWKENQRMHFIRDDSHKESTLDMLKQLLGWRNIDLLFIDWDHSYEWVCKDFEMYKSLVNPKSWIISFHDILHHPKLLDCQVDRFRNEIKRTISYRIYEFISPSEDHGWWQWWWIWVIEK